MKQIYMKSLLLTGFVLFSLLKSTSGHAQITPCPYNFPTGSTVFDTVINTPPGINTLEIKVPQADPFAGMVTCLKVCVTITGVVDSVSVENNSFSAQVANVYYIRTDQITGPGLTAPLTNSINHHYGPYPLAASNGTLGSGPDFTSISRDTLLNAVQLCHTITNLDSLFQFYGNDSISYFYDITAFTNVTCTGGNYNSTVATSAIVRFNFQYCTCPGYILPLHLRNFEVNKAAENKALLTWEGFNDPSVSYRYVTEMSRNGKDFAVVGSVDKNAGENDAYQFMYTTRQNESGDFYFRIKQVYSNGYSRFSEVRKITLKNSVVPRFIISPNPSDGVVGIKFDNNDGGKHRLEIFNAQGQAVIRKDIVLSGGSYQQIATLRSGIYWVKLTDLSSQLSAVSQLFIK
jgi:hypothetical protein